MNYRDVRSKVFLTMLLILLLISSSVMLNVSGPDSSESGIEIEEIMWATLTPRSDSVNIKNFTDFSGGSFVENTRIDPNGHVGLTWEPPQSPYSSDENTLLLSHFDNKYDGDEGEIAEIIDKNCMGYWDFDEGTGTIVNDRTDNENHGKIINGATWVKMSSGSALEFDGIDDYVTLPDIPLTNLTISHWVKANDVTGAEILTRRNGDSVPCNYQTQIYSNKFQFSRYLGSWTGWSTTNSLNTGQWYFLTATVEGGTLKLYIDGNLDSIHTITGIDPTGTQTTLLGKNRASTNWFDGIIDGVSIYNRPKSAEEIKADYNNQVSYYIPFDAGKFSNGIRIENNITFRYPVGQGIDPNCVGLWRFDECTGTRAKDISGNANDGTFNGWSEGNWTEGKYGGALEFDGVDDQVVVPDSNSFDTIDQITIEAWFNLKSTDTYINIVRKSWSDYRVYTLMASNTLFGLIRTTDGGYSLSGTTTLNSNKWYHSTLTYDGSEIKLYLNGKLDGTKSATGSLLKDFRPLQIGGGDPYSSFFNGTIDEVAIYNRAKSAKEIYQDYLGNFDMHQGTIDMWLKPDWNGNDGENHTIFFTGDVSNNDSFFIYKSDNGYLKFLTSDNQSNMKNNPQVNVNNWKKNSWYHLAFSWDHSGTKQIYIDGHLQAKTNNGIMPNQTYSELFIGSIYEPYYAFDGLIDEVRISDKIRTADELREYHDQGIYESPGIDAGEAVAWEWISWSGTTPIGTSLYLQSRTSDDNATWSEWMGNITPVDLDQKVYLVNTGEPINATNSQYLQWRAILKSSDGIFSPTLEKVSITWNQLPRVSKVKVTPSNPTDLDNLIINYDYSDTDNELESDDTTLEWYVRRGSEYVFSGYTGQTLSTTRTTRGERWFCRVTPHDGHSFGFSVDSNIVTIGSGPITRIEVTPGNINITADENVTFSAKAYDAADNEITTAFEWNITGDGTIDHLGLYEPTIAGVHGVYANAGGISGYAVVEVTPGELTDAKITPNNPSITTDDMIQFQGLALDAKGNLISNYTTTWSVTGGGILNPIGGTFEATESGEWTVSVNLTIVNLVNESGNISYNNKSANAETAITISPGKLDEIILEPKNQEITADSELQFTAIGYDQDDNTLGLIINWLVENGTITPSGLFKPYAVGTWKVTVYNPGSEVTGAASVNVLPGKPTKLVIEPGQKALKIAESFGFSVRCYDAKGNSWIVTEGISWSVTASDLGEVKDIGIFSALAAGELSLTAKYANITGNAGITIIDESEAEETKEELEEAQESKKAVEEQNFLLLAIIIILIIIILILFGLLASSRRKKEEKEEEVEDAEERVDETDDEETFFEEEPGESDVEDSDEDMEGSEEWEPEAEEEPTEEAAFELEPEPEVAPEKPIKTPKKGKMQKKGKIPMKRKAKIKVLKPEKMDKRPSGRPKLRTMDKAMKCNICLGYIKPGLNAVTCTCGKHYHEKCATRVGDCPVCDMSLQDPEDLLEKEMV